MASFLLLLLLSLSLSAISAGPAPSAAPPPAYTLAYSNTVLETSDLTYVLQDGVWVGGPKVSLVVGDEQIFEFTTTITSDVAAGAWQFCVDAGSAAGSTAHRRCTREVWQQMFEKELMLAHVSPITWRVNNEHHGIRRSKEWFEIAAEWLPHTIAGLIEPNEAPMNLLEIGAFEGGSTTFWQRYFLAHPDSRLVVVDTWQDTCDPDSYDSPEYAANPESIMEAFLNNVGKTANHEKVTALRGDSCSAMTDLLAQGGGGSFDFIYIDGSHRASEVLLDVGLGMRLLRVGGLMMLDDYKWAGGDTEGLEGEGEGARWGSGDCGAVEGRREATITEAIDVVLGSASGGVELVHCGYQLLVRKVEEAYDVGKPVRIL
ncbi:hypothetical protein TeGR_g2619 [Tetraparma gracilis]|uniref:Uncharacterized protein n=1 Tax=Tetraparma gracilis TaxID=2962635 RepID=A0ABQ6MIJ3_9STRA|nr:hypothetical protein TeGR_g2619 [Tetraparma gracilis]